MKIVPVQYFIYSKSTAKTFLNKSTGQHLFVLLELNLRVNLFLEIPEVDLQLFSEYSGRLL